MSQSVVNFSDLSSQKKQQFLNFLLSNNIKFQEGRGDYVAKVRMKDPKSTANKENRVCPHSPKPKSKNVHEQQSPISQSKQKRTLTPVNTNVERPIGKSKSKIQEKPAPSVSPKLRVSKPTHTRQATLIVKEFPKQKQPIKQTLNSQRNSVGRDQNEHHQPTRQTRQRSKSANSRQESKVIEKKRESKGRVNTSLQYIKTEASEQQNPPKKTSNYPVWKLNNLLTLLKINPTNGCRPTRLPRIQLLKCVEQIYNGNFARNTMLLKNRRFRESYEKGGCIFSLYVHQYFQERFKNVKLMQVQIINFVHSLLCYLHESNPPSSLQLFYGFLLEQHEYQDLVFFLFIRSIFQKQFVNDQTILQDYCLNKKEVSKLIRAIFGKDSQDIIEEFQQLVFNCMTNTIPVYDLFMIFLQDYQTKRKARVDGSGQCFSVDTRTTVSPTNKVHLEVPNQETKRGIKEGFKNSSRCSLFQEGNSDNFEQLTFGECNISSKPDEETESQFWNDSDEQISSDQLVSQLEAKLQRKVDELVRIMLADEESELRGPAKQLGRLIINKARKMLYAVHSMDKVRWFKLLRVSQPTQENLQTIESLQLTLRHLRKMKKQEQNDSARHIQSQFCKSLLTVEQLKKAIERIVIG